MAEARHGKPCHTRTLCAFEIKRSESIGLLLAVLLAVFLAVLYGSSFI
jgi:hypothetical protein